MGAYAILTTEGVSVITYTKTQHKIIVRLEGKRVGEIQTDLDGGFFYQPDGYSERGKTLPTIQAVKRSIEEE